MTAPYGSPAAPPMPPAPAPKKPRRWPWLLGMVGTLIIGIIIGSSSSSTPKPVPVAAAPSSTAAAPIAQPAPAASTPATPAAPAAPAGPATSFGDGTFKVGTDVAAGSYRSSGPRAGSPVPNCYWARMKDDSGSLDAVIANNNSQGPTRITVKAGEYLQVSGCDFTKA